MPKEKKLKKSKSEEKRELIQGIKEKESDLILVEELVELKEDLESKKEEPKKVKKPKTVKPPQPLSKPGWLEDTVWHSLTPEQRLGICVGKSLEEVRKS